MTKPLAYIDQNILGLQLEGRVDLSGSDDFQWTYSKEHFAEIRRSKKAGLYLGVLDDVGAKLLELEMKAWKLTGSARLLEHGTAEEHYARYCDAVDSVAFDATIFDPLQAWVNGGGQENLLRDVPGQFAEQLLALAECVPCELRPQFGPHPMDDFRHAIEQMLRQGNDIDTTRSVLGVGKGRVGAIFGANPIQQIWDMISPAYSGVSIEQFFGFEPHNKQGYESWPTYLGITGCCAILDILGFHAEKKCRRLDMLPNIRSDSVHIAMGAFCAAIFSADKRLIRRAKAIYEFRKIRTQCVWISPCRAESAQRLPPNE